MACFYVQAGTVNKIVVHNYNYFTKLICMFIQSAFLYRMYFTMYVHSSSSCVHFEKFSLNECFKTCPIYEPLYEHANKKFSDE